MAPLTERYNNPGAVEFHPWMSRYGATLGENGRFAQFQTPEQGYGVMGRILDTYQGKHGLNTVSGIINRWAPRNVDNNSTDEYIKSVSDALGLAPDAPLSADHRQPLMRAMANYEAGRSNLGGPTPTAQPSPQTATAMPITILPRSTTMPQNTDSPLVGLFRSSIENPLVLAGLGLYSASSQGQDIGSGLLRSVPLMQQADKMRQERERRAAVNELMNSPSMSGVNPTILGIARATGDPSLIAQDIYRGPQMDHLRQSTLHAQAMSPHQIMQAQYAAKTAEKQFNEPKPNTFDLGEGHVRYEMQRQPDGSQRAVPIAQGGVKQDAASKKAIWEAQDELPALQSTIEALERAKVLNPNAYTGMTAGMRGRVMTGLPFEVGATENAKATAEYQSLLNQQAIEAMSRTLKGATTDKEMGQFLSIIGDLSQPPELRARVLNRLLELSQRHKQVKVARIQELGGKTPDFAAGGAAPTPQQTPQGVKTLNGKTYINIDGQWYEQ